MNSIRKLIRALITEQVSLERRILSALIAHFEDPMRSLSQATIDELRSLRDGGQFNDLLVAPSNVNVHRGLHAISTKDLSKFTRTVDEKSDEDWVTVDVDAKYMSRAAASSWSTVEEIARRFADGLVANTFATARDPANKFDVVLTANTSNGDFILNPENVEKLPELTSFFEKLAKDANWVAMNEVIGIGDVPIQRITYRASNVNISKTSSLALHVGYEDLYVDYEYDWDDDDASEHTKGYTTEGWYVYRDGVGVMSGPFKTENQANASLKSLKR